MEGYLAFDCFCRNWRGATSRRRGGQTGLISLQRPLKFLPWDINEVIHRKTAARHTLHPPPPLPHPQQVTAASNPLAPPLLCDFYLGRAVLCQGRSPIRLPPLSMTAPDRSAPEQPADGRRGWGVGGGQCSCVCVAMPGEGDNSPGMCPTSTEKKIMFPQE